MTADFTYEAYRQLLDAGTDNGYEFITVRDYIASSTLPDRFIILRHDIDRKPENALDFAHFEAARGIPATYYFRTIEKTLRPRLIAETESLGHEIGYHYEDMDRADGDLEAAERSFAHHLSTLRRVATIDTVCMHGNPLTEHDNRDLWDGGSDFADFDLLGEAYLSMDFADVTYFSDTGRTWRDGKLKVKDHTMGDGEKRYQAGTTRELIELLDDEGIDRVCLLSHPNRWASSRPEYIVERTKDLTTNAGKRLLVWWRSDSSTGRNTGQT